MSDEHRVRVLWLVGGTGMAGTGGRLVSFARHLDRSRFEVEVAAVLPAWDPLLTALGRTGLPVHRMSGRLWPLRLRTLLRQRRFQVVHTHAPGPAVVARLLVRGRDAPRLVHTEHLPWPRHPLPTRLANAWTYRRNAAVVAVCEAVARSVRVPRSAAADPRWFSVVRHCPDLADAPSGPHARTHARDLLALDRHVVVIGSVASLTAHNDHHTLLDAYASLRRSHPGTVLVLIGAGPLEDRLRRYCAEIGLKDSVMFAGARSDVPTVLPALDVFAVSSRQQGLPMALLEAMAAGLPAVATRTDGVQEAATEGAEVLLVQPGDQQALSVALGRLVGAPALRARMSAAARERSRDYDPKGVQRELESVYRRVLDAD